MAWGQWSGSLGTSEVGESMSLACTAKSAALILLIGCSGALASAGCATSSSAHTRSGAAAGRAPQAQQAAGNSAPAPAQPVTQTASSDLPVIVFTRQGSGDAVSMKVEIADTPDSQEHGLMDRTSMPDDSGMIFIFSGESTIPFWMENTLIPLSIAFVDRTGVIVDIQEMEALSRDLHYPAKPYPFAIEANATWYSRNGVGVGDTVDVSQAIAASPVFGGGH